MNSEITNRKAPDEISLKEILLKIKGVYVFLLSKWLIVLFFGFLGAVIGFTYSFFKKPMYTAITTFVLEDGSSNSNTLGNLGGLASMVGVDLGSAGGGIFQGDNIIELYKSRTMIEQTLLSRIVENGKSGLLVDKYIEFNKLKEKWRKRRELQSLNFAENKNVNRLRDSVLGVFVDDIRINYLSVNKPDKKLSIIYAQVKASDEFFAKTFNDQIVKNVNDFYIHTKTKKSLNNIAILQQKVDSVRAVMNGAIYSAAAVVDATPNLNPTRQLQRTAPIQRSQFTAEANKAILSELVKNLELSKMSLRKETPLIQVVDEPIFPLVKTGTGKLKGLIIGGMLGGLAICLFLIIKKILKSTLS